MFAACCDVKRWRPPLMAVPLPTGLATKVDKGLMHEGSPLAAYDVRQNLGSRRW
jgi:hypothetical protein